MAVIRPPIVVALRALGLGDLLTAIPAFRALRDGFPAHRHVIATDASLAPILRLAGIEAAVVDTAGLFDRRHRLPGRPDVAVNLHGSGPQSHRRLLELSPRRMIAFRHASVGNAGPRWDADEHERRRWCRLLRVSGLAADPGDVGIDAPPVVMPAVRGATVVHPGAKARARRWPARRWAEVVRAEHIAGRIVLITGSSAERDLAYAVAEAAGLPARHVLAGVTTVLGLASIVAHAGLVVCGDTGVGHLATAFGTPSVLLFGPTAPSQWGPPSGAPHAVIWKGRRGDPHGDRTDPGLLEISCAEVIEAVAALRAEAMAS